MKTISKRELNQQTAQVLAGVQAGHAVLVSERGVVRWRIEAIDADPDPIARLRAQGRIIPAKANPAPWPRERARYKPADIDALFAESRGDR
jgi:antitoxin (DNA-binding transcriptional repressor) of toxin-antitoxin stability system